MVGELALLLLTWEWKFAIINEVIIKEENMDHIEYLVNEILPFWLEKSLDKEYGGILTCLDRRGEAYCYDKNVWFMGRAMYTFSYCYNNIKKDPSFLDFSENMYRFLEKCASADGRLPFIVARDGTVITQRELYYSETFAAIGCVEYYLATGKEQVRQRAEQYFNIAYDLYKKDLQRKPIPGAKLPEMRALGPSMIMLSVCQTMRKLGGDRYEAVIDEAIAEILRHFTDKGLLENVGLAGEIFDTPDGRLINPGHSLEAAWFLLAEAIKRDDAELKRVAKSIVDISIEIGYKDGGINSFADSLGRPSTYLEWDLKIWWPQCEALIALMLCYKTFGDAKYKELFDKLYTYVFEKFPDKTYGEWFTILHHDGTVSADMKGSISKGPFHLPRMLILLDKMEKGQPLIF